MNALISWVSMRVPAAPSWAKAAPGLYFLSPIHLEAPKQLVDLGLIQRVNDV